VTRLRWFWSGEFDGAQLDPEVWFFESGDGRQYGISGRGNNELQWYLFDRAEPSNRLLIVTAREELHNGKNYTWARFNGRDGFAIRCGRI